MTIQVNSDKTVVVDARLKDIVRGDVDRILKNFADRLTRVEVHLSDINSLKGGSADKRCLVEARPAGARPLSTSATADHLATAIDLALRKMRRALTSFFGRRPRGTTAGASAARKKAAPKTVTPKVVTRKKASPKASVSRTRKDEAAAPTKPATTKSAGQSRTTAKTTGRSPKKKGIFLARRKAWPSR
jgi:ribosome-associated translation inhibitor RaiA